MSEKEALFGKIDNSTTFSNICEAFGLRSKAVLDIGCGYGQYLRHFGKGSLGITTAAEEVEFGRESGLNIALGNAERLGDDIGKFEAIWANNLYEHLLSPHAFLMNLKKISDERTLVILGVPVVPKIVTLMNLKWWRGALASNHVNFFTHTTLRLTVERAGWKPVAVRPFIFKNSLLDLLVRPFAPHIYIVAKNDLDFRYAPKKVGEWLGDEHYAGLLQVTGQNK